MSESVNTQDVAGEILELAELACALESNPRATPSDFKHLLLGNRLTASPAPGDDSLFEFTVPQDSMWILTYIWVRSHPTPAVDGGGVFNPLGGDFRSNQDLTPNNSVVAGQGASNVWILINGTPVTFNGVAGIMPQLVLNRPLLLVYRSKETFEMRVATEGPAVPVIDLEGVINSFLVPVHIGNCLAKLQSSIQSAATF